MIPIWAFIIILNTTAAATVGIVYGTKMNDG